MHFGLQSFCLVLYVSANLLRIHANQNHPVAHLYLGWKNRPPWMETLFKTEEDSSRSFEGHLPALICPCPIIRILWPQNQDNPNGRKDLVGPYISLFSNPASLHHIISNQYSSPFLSTQALSQTITLWPKITPLSSLYPLSLSLNRD